MRITFPTLSVSAVVAAAILFAPGCGIPIRICTGCNYKSKVNFSDMPVGTITSAQMEVRVTHSGACPQSPGKPPNCTEVKVYDVKCKVGTQANIVVPFFLDAAPGVTNHSSKIIVVKDGVSSTHTGTVDLGSNVPGGAAPPGGMPALPSPCPVAKPNPYNPFPAVVP